MYSFHCTCAMAYRLSRSAGCLLLKAESVSVVCCCLQDIFRKYPNQYESIIATLCENLDSLDEPEARYVYPPSLPPSLFLNPLFFLHHFPYFCTLILFFSLPLTFPLMSLSTLYLSASSPPLSYLLIDTLLLLLHREGAEFNSFFSSFRLVR